MKFYLSFDCARCDETMYYGPVLTLLEHDGLPVTPTTLVEHARFDCHECGARNYVGELDVFVEDDDDDD